MILHILVLVGLIVGAYFAFKLPPIPKMTERWVIGDTQATVTGRTNVPWFYKINPIWWFKNDVEQRLNDGTTDWWAPGYPEWIRRLTWEFRNPIQNLRSFVLGVQDKNYTVRGRAPVMTSQRDDLGETGWQWSVLSGGDLWVPRPYVAYTDKNFVFYIGWQASGFFGAKINRWSWAVVAAVAAAVVIL